MKIVLINNLFGEYARGGAERIVKTIADGLVDKGHEVVVVSTQPLQFSIFQPKADPPRADNFQFSIKDKIQNTKYKIQNFYPFNIISYYNLVKLPTALKLLWHVIDVFNLQSYFKIKKILKKEKPDIVMTHNLTGVGFLTPLAIKHCNIKHIHTLHDIQLLHPSGLMIIGQEKKVDGLFAKVYQRCAKKLFASADVVISPSRWLLDEHVRRGFFRKSKCVVMANPTTLCHSRPLRHSCSEASESGNPDNDARDSRLRGNDNKQRNDNGKFVFLCVGQMEKHKGIEMLIDAFVKLQKDDCELWIVGEQSQKSKVKSQKLGIDAKIKFFGKKDNAEVQSLMRQANCLVVPSLCYENQPTVIREAQQNNLPVIASDIGGIPEILNHEFLFKAGDKESLKNKMQWVMGNYQKIKDTVIAEKNAGYSTGDYVDKMLKL